MNNTHGRFIVAMAVFSYVSLAALGCGQELPDPLWGVASAKQSLMSTSTPSASGQGVHGLVASGDGDGTGIVSYGQYGVVAYGQYSGVVGQGGAGHPGGEFRAGVASTATAPSNAAYLPNGNLSMDGVANPAPSVPLRNTLTPSNITKAWASIETSGDGAYQASVTSGVNVAHVGVAAHDVEIYLAHPVASGCAATVTPVDLPLMCTASCSGPMVRVRCYRFMSGSVSPYNFGGESATRISVNVNGLQ